MLWNRFLRHQSPFLLSVPSTRGFPKAKFPLRCKQATMPIFKNDPSVSQESVVLGPRYRFPRMFNQAVLFITFLVYPLRWSGVYILGSLINSIEYSRFFSWTFEVTKIRWKYFEMFCDMNTLLKTFCSQVWRSGLSVNIWGVEIHCR